MKKRKLLIAPIILGAALSLASCTNEQEASSSHFKMVANSNVATKQLSLASMSTNELLSICRQYKNDSKYVYNYGGGTVFNVFQMFEDVYLSADMTQTPTSVYEADNDTMPAINFKQGYIYAFYGGEEDLQMFEEAGINSTNSTIYSFDYSIFENGTNVDFSSFSNQDVLDQMNGIVNNIPNIRFNSFYTYVIPKQNFTSNSYSTSSGYNVYELEMYDKLAPDFINDDNYLKVNINDKKSTDWLLSQISVYDETDGDVSDTLELVSTTYNQQTSGPGKYEFKVKAHDRSNNVVQGTFYVLVYDIDFPEGSGRNITTGNSQKLTEDELLELFTFSDNYGEVTKSLDASEYDDNWQTPGTISTIYCTGTDSVGNQTTVSAQITINDTTPPTMPNYNPSIRVGNHELITDFTKYFNATDDYTGVVIRITENTYTENYKTPGVYHVKAYAEDDDGNRSPEADLTITVYDSTKPTISDTTKQISYTQKLSDDDIKALFNYSDDVTKKDSIIFEITSNPYSEKYNSVGSYNVVVRVTDEAGNFSNATVTINVIDDIKPVITAPQTIEVSNLHKLSLEEIKTKITVNDGYDGAITNYTITGYDQYLEAYNSVGQISLTINAKDKASNVATHTINIVISDEMAPGIFVAKDLLITTTKGEVLTQDQILSYLSQIGEINLEDVVSVKTSYDNSKVGLYKCSILLKDGTTYEANIQVDNNVVEDPFEFGDIFTKEFWANSWNHFVDNLFKPAQWNWLNYVALVVSIVLVIGVISYIYKKLKKGM